LHSIAVLTKSRLQGKDVSVQAKEIEHTSKCWGFVFKEVAPRGRFNLKKAAALGIPEGPLRGVLARGGSVLSPVTGDVITHSQVCDPNRPSRKIGKKRTKR
jgi:ribonuclease Z